MEGQLIDGYRIGKLIGSGSYGSVYMAQNDERKYAIKITKGRIPIQELDIMKRFHHDNLAKALDFFFVGNNIAIVMEIADMDLIDYITKYVMDDNMKIKFMYEIASAVNFLHSNNIIHGDIKLDNILIYNNRAVLTDFGMATNIDSKPGAIGSVEYAAPEILKTIHKMEVNIKTTVLDFIATDIWALGCTFFLLMTGYMFVGNDRQSIAYNINLYINNPNEYLTELSLDVQYFDLIKSMLKIDPIERPHSIIDILKFNIFKSKSYSKPIGGLIWTKPISPIVSCEIDIRTVSDMIIDFAFYLKYVSAGSIFQAFDIMYRTYKSIPSDKLYIFGPLCLLMGLYFNDKNQGYTEYEVSYYLMNENTRSNFRHNILTADFTTLYKDTKIVEQIIIKSLVGILSTDNYFTYAFSRHALILSLDILLDCNTYITTNPEQFMNKLMNQETNDERLNRKSKYVEFKELYTEYLRGV